MLHQVGVDISESKCALFNGKSFTEIANRERAIKKWLSTLEEKCIIAMESTGTYGLLLARLCYEAGHTVYILTPSWIKHHRLSSGTRGKTDKTDSQAIYRFITETSRKLHPWRPMEPRLERIKQMKRERRTALQDLERWQNKNRAQPEKGREPLMDSLKNYIAQLDQQLEEALKEWESAEFIQSIPGVKLQTAAAVLPALEHHQFTSADSFVAFAGLDPVAHESGKFKGRRRISKRGDVVIRDALYMAALSAGRSKAFKPLFEKLKKTMCRMHAVLALARHLIKLIYTLFKKKEKFQLNPLDMKL